MRILFALTVFAFACGGPKPKGESALVNEGVEQSPTCCCKTMPKTAEKEIIPEYATVARMECSAAKGDCVDDVQCNATGDATQDMSPSEDTGAGADGVPPPPTLEPETTTTP